MCIDVITVKTAADFHLELEFSNGECRRFDMKPLLKMKPWNRLVTLSLFEQVRIDYGTVTWLEGEIDIAPETLYDFSVLV
ncbi:MAG: DUF2442 domain-containing protein [Methylococcaceae bacterium]